MQARRGELVDVVGGDGGRIAERDGRRVGLVLWRLEPGDASARAAAAITALAVEADAQGSGIGRALMVEAEVVLRRLGIARLWLITTNDNLAALALYQKVGYRLVALHAGAIDEIRRKIKPSIPLVSGNGIRVRDELELERELDLRD
jgi:ribosomal protein S18 acetylase RimI-like enzyme